MSKGSLSTNNDRNNTLGFDKVSLDHEYDTSKIGPGSYEHFVTFDKNSSNSKIHKTKPTFSFGIGKKNNESQYLSKEQW